METKSHFRNLLLISHYYALRSACRHVPTLKAVGVKISTALLRYTDIIPADKAFYEAGIQSREEYPGSLLLFVFCRQRLEGGRKTVGSVRFPQPLPGPVRSHRRGRGSTGRPLRLGPDRLSLEHPPPQQTLLERRPPRARQHQRVGPDGQHGPENRSGGVRSTRIRF
jgi:hypothetical protein